MKGKTKRAARLLTLAVSAAVVLPAHAVLVFDPLNFLVNFGSKMYLKSINHQLKDGGAGTVNYYTKNIKKHTLKIENHTLDIKNTAIDIKDTTNNIDTTTTNILEINQLNLDIDASFTWIINEDGDEIIPIPGPVQEKLKKILNWKDPETFSGQFKSVADYGALPEGGYSQDATIEGSRARKAANDTLVQAIGSDQEELNSEVTALTQLRDMNKNQGHGHQLQPANALAGSQVNQLMKLRSMMLVSEASRAVEAQAAADKDARAIAVGSHLRRGLDKAVSQSLVPLPKY